MARITLKTFDSAITAHIIKNRLENEGIRCYILDENIVSLNPLLNYAVGGVRIQIEEMDIQRASIILNEIENKPLTDENETVIKCPKCESHNLYSDFNSLKTAKGIVSFIVSLVFSTFPIYLKSVYKCKDCGAEFEKH